MNKRKEENKETINYYQRLDNIKGSDYVTTTISVDSDKLMDAISIETHEKIKIKTYNNMYYTYWIIDNNMDSTSEQEQIHNILQSLYKMLNEDDFIYLPLENKILNTKDIKETLIGL